LFWAAEIATILGIISSGQGTSQEPRLSTGFPYKVLSLNTKPGVLQADVMHAQSYLPLYSSTRSINTGSIVAQQPDHTDPMKCASMLQGIAVIPDMA
jgi:hypothetical protein